MPKPILPLAILFAGLAPSLAHAQTPYVVSAVPGTYTPVTGGTTHVPAAYSFFDQWDEGAAAIALPFSFTWYNVEYTTIYAYTNGFLSFDAPPSNASVLGPPSQVPSNADSINNHVGVMWADLDGAVNAAIRTVITGTAPNRVFTIQYENFVGFSAAQSAVNFQVRLFEGTDQVQVVMGNNFGILNGATVMENAAGTEGQSLLTACGPADCSSAEWPSGLTITIALPAGPELLGALTVPNGGYPGTTFQADLALRNIGLSPTTAFDYRVYFSASRTSTAGATVLGTYTQVAIPASTTINVSRTFTVPAVPVGTYYVVLAVDIDNDVVETLENNNITYSTPFTTGPDLVGTVTAPSQTGPGEALDLSLSIQSTGAPVAAMVRVAFYLSADELLDVGDTALGNRSITLPDGFSYSGTQTLTVPLNQQPSPPSFWVLAVIDDNTVIPETNENNNLLVSGSSLQVEGPDLDVPTITAGPFAFRGLPYPVTTQIRNVGGATANNFTLCVFLSDNLLISVVSDLRIAEIPNLTLAPGEVQDVELQPLIPASTSTGTWYVASVADCDTTVLESNENNNVRRRVDSIIVRDPAPDFTPLEIATSSAGAAGENTPVSVRIANLGNLTGETHLRLVISSDPGIGPEDLTIFETTSPLSLTPPGERTLSVWGALPGDLPSGNYYVAAIVDPDGLVDEVYESNNVISRGPIVVTGADLAVTSPNPPNAIIGAPYVVRFHAVGGSAGYLWSIAWDDGLTPAGLTFDAATAQISGNPLPAAEGRHGFSLSVTSGNLTAVKHYSLLITPPTLPLTIVSSRLPPAVAGEAYSVQLVGVGGVPPYRWALVPPPALPSGLGLSPDGELAGQPQLVGPSTFRVRVTDLEGTQVLATLALDIVDPGAAISIVDADVSDATVGELYAMTFRVAGGNAPYRWRLEGSIAGLSFDGMTAELTGTPTIAGSYPITVEVRDSTGLLDRNAYVLQVLEAGELRITTGQNAESALPAAKVAEPYLANDGTPVRLRAIPAEGVRWSLIDGDLPPGLILDLETGLIEGVPTIEGIYPFIVLARNPANDLRRATLVIVVDPVDPADPLPPDDGCSCRTDSSAGGSPWLFLGLLAAFLIGRRRWALLVVVAGLGLSGTASAQPVPYEVFSTTEPYVGLGSGATVVSPGLGDGGTTSIVLPFQIYLYGEAFSTLYINANGVLAVTNLGQGNHNPPLQTPNASTPNGFIAPLWDDWCASSSSCFTANSGMGIYYQIDSTPGQGKVDVEFRRLTHFNDGVASSDVTFRVTIYEGIASQIEFRYGTITSGTDFGNFPTDFFSRIGLESSDGTYGMWIAPCAGASAGCSSAQAHNLSNTKITLIADAGDDIAAGGVSLPTIGYPGLPLAVTARALSRHQNPLGPFHYAAYLVSAVSTSTTGGRLIHQGGPITLSAFEARPLSFEAEIPDDVEPGQYHVAFLVDSDREIAETDERNNLGFSTQEVRIAERAPDFRVTRVRPLQNVVAPGDRLEVAYRLENAGNEPGQLIAQVVLSQNQAITTTDLPFGVELSFETTPRQVLTGTISALVPEGLRTGRYYLGILTDPLLQVPELNEANNVGRSAQPITVAASQVEILTESLPVATEGRSYSAVLSAAGGNGSFSYALVSGTLPAGLSFQAQSAELAGVATETGSFELEFEASSGATSGRRALTLTVVDPDYNLTVVSRNLPPGVLGEDYGVQLQGVGGRPPYSWRVLQGALPVGFQLAADGTLYGAPTEVGYSPFRVQIRDDASATATASLALEIRPPTNLTIASAQLPEARVGEPYTQELRALGGVGTVTWHSITTAPPGLVVSESGALGGIPEKIGMYRFVVEAIDGHGNRDTNALTVTVSNTGRLVLLTSGLPEGQPNSDFRSILRAEGGKPPYTWEVVRGEGFLPPDFTAEKSPGVAEGESPEDFILSGKLTQEGSWAFTVRVYDQQGRSDQQAFAIISRYPPPPPAVIEEGCSCSTAGRSRGSAWPMLGLLAAWGLRRRRWAAFLVLIGLSAASPAQAQVSVPYFLNQYTAPYVPLVAGITIVPDSMDDGTALVPIGFNFEFYGVTYDTVSVGVNGGLAFANSCTTSSDCDGFTTCSNQRCQYGVYTSAPTFTTPPAVSMPNIEVPNRLVTGFWDDLYLESTSSMSYAVVGTAPNRECVIQWSGIRHYPNGSGTSHATFQIRLSEGSGAVRVHYGPMVSGTNNAAWTGAFGIENTDGTDGVVGHPCSTDNGCGFTELTALSGQILEYVGPLGAELVLAGSAPTGGEVGSSLSLDATVRNIGLMPTGVPFVTRIYFSTDSTIDASDTLLGTINFPAQASQTSVTRSLSFTVPNVAPGYYSIGGIVDATNVVTEDIETNNTTTFRTDFLIGADLGVSVRAPGDSGPGEVVQVPVSILNYGSAQSAVLVRVYFSPDETLDATDTLIGTATVTVPAQPSTLFDIASTIPNILPGRYHSIAVVDPLDRIIEADETNNVAASTETSELTGPDLYATQVRTTESFLFRGQPFPISGNMGNIGGGGANGFYYAFYLSTNTLINIFSDPQVGEYGPISLAPGEAISVTETALVPANLTPGPYYLGFAINTRNNVLEQFQVNNKSNTMTPIIVRDPAPDFSVLRIRIPAVGAAGETLTVERILANQGNAPGVGDYEVYLSTDASIDPATDTYLGRGQLSLTAGAEDADVDQVAIPPTVLPGSYYVGYVLDPNDDVEELYEDNNRVSSTARVSIQPNQLQILNQSMPLATLNSPYEVMLAASGAAGPLSWAATATVPPGLVLESNGRLHGEPTAEGPFMFQVQVTDGSARAERDFSILVASETLPLEVASAGLLPGFIGRPYEFPVVAFGGVTPYRWTTSGDALVPGLVFSSDGVISGTPTQAGLANITFRVTDAVGAFAERRLVLRVVTGGNSVRLANDLLPDGRLGESYDEELRVAQGTGASPFTFEVAAGELPPGLALEVDPGTAIPRVTGLPTEVGLFDFTIRVSDSRGDFDLNRFLVTIDEGEGVTFVSTSLPQALTGVVYQDEVGSPVRLKAVSLGQTGELSYSLIQGELPPGLELSADGLIAGTPASAGVFSFTALAVDSAHQFDVRAFGIVVETPEQIVDTLFNDDGCSCRTSSSLPAGSLWSGLVVLGLLALRSRRTRRVLPFLGLALALSTPAQAQSGVYQSGSALAPYVQRTGGTVLPFPTSDDDSVAITLPFSFHFFDQDFTVLNVGTNGYATFGSNTDSYSNGALPASGSPPNMIALAWDDWSTQSVEWFLEGTAPNRVVIVQYTNGMRLSGPAGGMPQIQLWLFEGPAARFEIHFGGMTGMTAPSEWTSTIGYQDEGVAGEMFGTCSPSCDGDDLAALADSYFFAQQDGGTDVIAVSIGAPVDVYAGVPFPAPVTLQSPHGGLIGPFVFTVHLLTASETTPNHPIYTSPPVTLQPFQTLVVTSSPAVPLGTPDGAYRLAVVADSASQVMEPNETNNIAIGRDEFRIGSPRPDFRVAAVNSSVSSGAPGASVTVYLGLENAGNLDGSAAWKLYLSRNSVITSDDLELAQGNANLPLLTTVTATVPVTLPSDLVPGRYYFGAVLDPDNTVPELVEINNAAAATQPFAVTAGTLGIATTALPPAYVGQDYSFFLVGSGGDGSYSWRLASGALPAGVLLLANTGEVRGRPSAVGSATVEVEVSSAGATFRASLTLAVTEVDGGLTIVTRQLLPGIVGAAYPPAAVGTSVDQQQHLVAVGGQAEVTWSLVSPAPLGLSLASDGYLSGIPAQAGVYDVTVSATDGSDTVTRALRLTLAEPGRLTLVAADLPNGRLGEDYNQLLNALGQDPSKTIAFSTAGPLPPGLTLTEEGRLVGIPQRTGVWSFSVEVAESGTDGARDSAGFRLQIDADSGFGITPSSVPSGTVGQVYTATLEARQGRAPFTWRVSGGPLPRGLAYEVVEDAGAGAQALRFAGTPEEAGAVSVLVSLVDNDGRRAELPVTLLVNEVPAPAPPLVEESGCTCRAAAAPSSSGASWALFALLGLLLGGRRAFSRPSPSRSE